MGWVYANDRSPYEGETHELIGKTFSGKTRTPMSRRVEWVDEMPKARVPSQPKPPRAKPAPKARGATAWD